MLMRGSELVDEMSRCLGDVDKLASPAPPPDILSLAVGDEDNRLGLLVGVRRAGARPSALPSSEPLLRPIIASLEDSFVVDFCFCRLGRM